MCVLVTPVGENSWELVPGFLQTFPLHLLLLMLLSLLTVTNHSHMALCSVLLVLFGSQGPEGTQTALQLVLNCHLHFPLCTMHTPTSNKAKASLCQESLYTQDKPAPRFQVLEGSPAKRERGVVLTPGSAGCSLGSSVLHTEASPPHRPGGSSSESGESASGSAEGHLTGACNWVHRAGRSRACGWRAMETAAGDCSPS